MDSNTDADGNNNSSPQPFTDRYALESLRVFAKKIRKANNKYELIDTLKDDIVAFLGFSTVSIFQLVEGNCRQIWYKGHSSRNALMDVDVENHQCFDVDGDPWLEHIVAADDVVYAHDMMAHPLTNKELVKTLKVSSIITRRIEIVNHTLIICISNYNYDPPVKKLSRTQLVYFDVMCDLISNMFDIKTLENVRLFQENNILTVLGMKWHISRLMSSYSRSFKPFGLLNITLHGVEKSNYDDILKQLSLDINAKLRAHELLCINDKAILVSIESVDIFPLKPIVERLSNEFTSIVYGGSTVDILLDITIAECPTDGFSFEDLISTSRNRKVKTTKSAPLPDLSLFDTIP